ncbi:GNAT family N-acetyltransferase [Nocardia sp. NPDC055321]
MLPAAYLDGDLYEERLGIWRSRLSAPAFGASLFLIEDESGLEGFVYLTPEPADRVLLDNLHVRATGKRRGTGTRLLRHAMRWTAENYPGRAMYLEVLEANTPAIAFYERHGGVRTAHRVTAWPQGFSTPEFEYTWPATALLPNDSAR